MSEVEQLAKRIVQAYDDASDTIRKRINESPELYRAMMYELNVVDGEAIDGTDHYWDIVFAVEDILINRCPSKVIDI